MVETTDRVAGAAEASDRDGSDRTPLAGANASAPHHKPPRDLRQELTDRMIAVLDQGTIPWERPWHEIKVGRPRNVLTARDYRGGNRFMLMMVQLEKGYSDPRFGTFRQINQLGGTVTKGQKGFPIEYWGDRPFYERRDVSITHGGRAVGVVAEGREGVLVRDRDEAAKTRRVQADDLLVRHEGRTLGWRDAHQKLDRVIAQVSTVFNVEQCSGLKIEPVASPPQTVIEKIERAEQLMASMRADGLSYATDNRGAYYMPKLDTVYLPEPERFRSSEAYYGTALHEIGHATGAEQRLNREGIVGEHRFGTDGYAREELRAELFSVFMAAETGLPHDETQHRAYVQHWGRILKSDKHEIFRAAAQAGNAIDYVFEKETELNRAKNRTAEVERQTESTSERPVERPSAELEPMASDEVAQGSEYRRAYARHRGLER